MRITSPGCSDIVAANLPLADEGAVAAVQIAQRPIAAGHEDFGVLPAGAFILNDDLVRPRAADGHGPPRDETIDVRPFRSFANDQIGQHAWQRKNSCRATRNRARASEASAGRGESPNHPLAPASTLACPPNEEQGRTICRVLSYRRRFTALTLRQLTMDAGKWPSTNPPATHSAIEPPGGSPDFSSTSSSAATTSASRAAIESLVTLQSRGNGLPGRCDSRWRRNSRGQRRPRRFGRPRRIHRARYRSSRAAPGAAVGPATAP